MVSLDVGGRISVFFILMLCLGAWLECCKVRL